MTKSRPKTIDVLDFLRSYCESSGWPTTNPDIYETLLCEDEVWKGDYEDEDHFVYYSVVVQVAGQFIKWEDARAKDNSEFEFSIDSICFVEKTVEEVINYE